MAIDYDKLAKDATATVVEGTPTPTVVGEKTYAATAESTGSTGTFTDVRSSSPDLVAAVQQVQQSLSSVPLNTSVVTLANAQDADLANLQANLRTSQNTWDAFVVANQQTMQDKAAEETRARIAKSTEAASDYERASNISQNLQEDALEQFSDSAAQKRYEAWQRTQGIDPVTGQPMDRGVFRKNRANFIADHNRLVANYHDAGKNLQYSMQLEQQGVAKYAADMEAQSITEAQVQEKYAEFSVQAAELNTKLGNLETTRAFLKDITGVGQERLNNALNAAQAMKGNTEMLTNLIRQEYEWKQLNASLGHINNKQELAARVRDTFKSYNEATGASLNPDLAYATVMDSGLQGLQWTLESMTPTVRYGVMSRLGLQGSPAQSVGSGQSTIGQVYLEGMGNGFQTTDVPTQNLYSTLQRITQSDSFQYELQEELRKETRVPEFDSKGRMTGSGKQLKAKYEDPKAVAEAEARLTAQLLNKRWGQLGEEASSFALTSPENSWTTNVDYLVSKLNMTTTEAMRVSKYFEGTAISTGKVTSKEDIGRSVQTAITRVAQIPQSEMSNLDKQEFLLNTIPKFFSNQGRNLFASTQAYAPQMGLEFKFPSINVTTEYTSQIDPKVTSGLGAQKIIRKRAFSVDFSDPMSMKPYVINILADAQTPSPWSFTSENPNITKLQQSLSTLRQGE